MNNISKYSFILLAGSTFVSAVAAEAKGDAWEKSVNAQINNTAAAQVDRMNVVNRTDIGRQEVDMRGDALVKKANEAFAKGDFLAACKLYIAAKKEFQKFNSNVFVRKTAYCDRNIARCYNE